MDWNLIIYLVNRRVNRKVNDMMGLTEGLTKRLTKKNELINNRDYNIGDLIGRLPDVDMKYVKIIRDDDYYDGVNQIEGKNENSS